MLRNTVTRITIAGGIYLIHVMRNINSKGL